MDPGADQTVKFDLTRLYELLCEADLTGCVHASLDYHFYPVGNAYGPARNIWQGTSYAYEAARTAFCGKPPAARPVDAHALTGADTIGQKTRLMGTLQIVMSIEYLHHITDGLDQWRSFGVDVMRSLDAVAGHHHLLRTDDMIRHQTVSGLQINNPDLPVITRAPGDEKATVPGWICMLNPDFLPVDGMTVRNRALPRSQAEAFDPQRLAAPWITDEPAAFARNGNKSTAIYCTGAISPGRESVFFPVRNFARSTWSSSKILVQRNTLQKTADIALNFFVNDAGIFLGIAEQQNNSGKSVATRLPID